ncbi:MAG: flagellar biosynthesis protein FlhB [Bdellovibrionaceae bacterium]|nr:flagellar biosynthesis protein FlhB [Pseudobdellovibrionaceae bacterium]|tara:strand:- start:25004 stop:26071 length:1068 start_codon:yes stop_codon:yes gene_type:complete
MADSDNGEKTEEATPQRREDFRKRGQVAQTKELATVFILFTALLSIWLLGRFFMQNILEIFNLTFTDYLVRSAREGDYAELFVFTAKKITILLGPLFLIFWIMGFASSAVQVGFLVNEEAMQFKTDKINPMNGLKRLFSLRSLVEGAKAIFKLLCVGAVVMLLIKNEVTMIPFLTEYSIEQLFGYVNDIVLKLFAGVGFFMLVIAGADYFFQRFDLEEKMKMTKQEVKEEMKSREGDPLIKARIRKVQREMATQRMMEDVPKADVIITNPTHIAVAIRYDQTMVAPKILAKGADSVAERIKDRAKEHGIPIVENKPLARLIFKTIEIGQAIPRELYTAVAEVLSYVYRLKKKVIR